MNERCERLKAALDVKCRPICTEKFKYCMESFRKTEGLAPILQRAYAIANYLDHRTVLVQPDELIVGNFAAKPMGMEIQPNQPIWTDEDLKILIDADAFELSEEDRQYLRSADSYWNNCGRTETERKGRYYDDERIWPFIKRGFLCPPWKSKTIGRGQGQAGAGWGWTLGTTTLLCPNYEYIIAKGFDAVIAECEEALRNLRYDTPDCLEKADFYQACLIELPAVVRHARRFSAEAKRQAELEQDPKRKAELEQIAEICWNVPAKPAKTFREAIQAFWFYMALEMGGTTPGARFDQYMYPYYKADLEAGRITYEEAKELCICLRLKICEYHVLFGGTKQREKWAGGARWHNFILGGTDRDGNDITNDVSYMMLEAAMETHTPQPTLTVRVHENMPDAFLKKAVDCIATGMGMPAMISEKSYAQFLIGQGIDPKEANDFAIAGCLDLMLPGRSRNHAVGMFIIPMVLELAMNDGCEPKTGEFYGVHTGQFTDFKTWDEFYDAFLKNLEVIIGLISEDHNIQILTHAKYYPDVATSAFFEGAIEAGRDALSRKMKYENCSFCNVVGMANLVDSLAALKKLVFEEKKVSAETMMAALKANWEGYEDVHKLCLNAPKFGNNDDYVDELASQVWEDFARITLQQRNCFGTPMIPAGISITAHAPGGSMTSATPDGRYDGETLADGSLSPEQGKDVNGPLGVFNSGMKIKQDNYSAVLLNMKFHSNTMKTDEDKAKFAAMVKTYLTHGGKQVQFNVIDDKVLKEAKEAEDKNPYKDIIVRVAGYSSYFVVLTPRVQDEIIKRTAHEI